ncbi:1,2-dihydroxy-3-keto-5-methylthiopentene dioxygenase [Blastocladiella emersonii ATCC 22665]|nr:1,2-dihydroxy-3-keto-5-methylthiopentene dioxygenase [Blastocladiella emersonii ATCC 22665]
MVRVYYYDNTDADPREPHVAEGEPELSFDDLAKTGVLYWRHDVSSESAYLATVDAICAERSYKNRDVITVSPTKLPNYEEKIKSFFDEHLHEDEEIRFILDGSGYFDVRDKADRWIRIALDAGDMIVLPAGIYHRFTLDSNNYIKAMRLFKDDPKWTPLSRKLKATDNVPSRAEYLAAIASAEPAEAEMAEAPAETAGDDETAESKKRPADEPATKAAAPKKAKTTAAAAEVKTEA